MPLKGMDSDLYWPSTPEHDSPEEWLIFTPLNKTCFLPQQLLSGGMCLQLCPSKGLQLCSKSDNLSYIKSGNMFWATLVTLVRGINK